MPDRSAAPAASTPVEAGADTQGYNPVAVNQAIASARRPISAREARLIHALLKGRSPARQR